MDISLDQLIGPIEFPFLKLSTFYRKHPYAGKGVSDFLLSFDFMTKNG